MSESRRLPARVYWVRRAVVLGIRSMPDVRRYLAIRRM